MRSSIVTATIRQVVPYGLWLQHQEAAILVKIVDVSWGRIPPLEESFREGEQVAVKVMHQITDEAYLADSPLKRAGYQIATVWVSSIKELHPEENPWREPFPFTLGQRVEGAIRAIVSYGFFVEIAPGLEGLVLGAPDQKRQRGDKCSVMITELRIAEQRVGLALIEEADTLS